MVSQNSTLDKEDYSYLLLQVFGQHQNEFWEMIQKI